MVSRELAAEPRWTAEREVLTMAGPIVLSMVAYTLMESLDTFMVGRVSTAALAAVGSAALWTWLIAAVTLGLVSCVSTFISQSIGRGTPELAASYTWQSLHIGTIAGVVSLFAWPFAYYLFATMGHTPEVTNYETAYFRIRLLGFAPMIWCWTFTAVFMALERPNVPMYVAFAGNAVNAVLNYLLIFGKFGLPELGIEGAAWGTTAAQWVQAGLFFAIFLGSDLNKQFRTRTAWRFHRERFFEMLRIGIPSGLHFLMDIATWGVFISYLVGSFGDAALAANNIALACMKLSFMPAVAMNQAIGPIVGQYIGKGDFPRAINRTWSATRIVVVYMGVLGVIVALAGPFIIRLIDANPEVVDIGYKLLILAAVFQVFDAINIVVSGALRGAGDTQFMMWMTAIAAYPFFLPLAYLIAVWGGGGAVGAWIAAAIYIFVLSMILSWRFASGRWRRIDIFIHPHGDDETHAALAASSPAPVVTEGGR